MSDPIVLALNSIGLLTKMAKGFLDARTDAEIQKAVMDLNSTIIDLHGRILEIQLQNETLLRVRIEAEEKLKHYEQWEVERTKYALKEPKPGVFVYALKPEYVGEQPAHWLCPKCYEDRKKSILQAENRRDPIFDGTRCPECGANFQTGRTSRPS